MRAKQAHRHAPAAGVSNWMELAEETLTMLAKQGVLKTYSLWFLAALMIGLLSWQGHKLIALFDHPIERIEVQGQFEQLDQKSLETALSGWVDSSFLGANLVEIKETVEALPWVRTATVHRVWPGQIVLEIKEQSAVANWGDQAYLNDEGELFAPAKITWDQQRPRLLAEFSVDQQQRKEMLSLISDINDRLERDGLRANQLMLDPRGAWEMGLQDGPIIVLGTEPFSDRIGRAVKVYTQLQTDAQLLVDRIDARYPNGVAVKWKEMALASNNVNKKQ